MQRLPIRARLVGSNKIGKMIPEAEKEEYSSACKQSL